MTSEVGHECAVKHPRELGTLSPHTDVTRQCPQEDTHDDSSSGSGADTAKTTSGLTSGHSLLTAADRLQCRATEGEEGVDTRSRSGYDDDLESRENSLRDCATQRQRQLLPVSRSQYHSIQQLSRPSINLAQTSGYRLFSAECTYQLDNNTELYCHSNSQASGSAGVAAGRCFNETCRLRDDTNKETVSQATECDRKQDRDGTTHGDTDDDVDDVASACTESAMDDDERPTDADRRGADGHGQQSPSQTVNVASKTWSSEARQNGGSSTSLEDELEAKRARVEHIVRSMQTPPSDGQQSSTIGTCQTTHHQQQLIDGRRQRRKQFAPLQHQHDGHRPAHLKRSYDDDDDSDGDDTWYSLDDSEHDALRLGLQRVQDRLTDMRNKYMNYLDESSEDDVIVDVGNDVRTDEPVKCLRDSADDAAVIGADFNRNEIVRARGDGNDTGSTDSSGSGSLDALARMLKAEISDSVGNMVDEIVRSFVARRLKVAGGDGGSWRRVDPADGHLTPTHQLTMSTTLSPDTHLTAPRQTDSDAVPPPLTPIRTSTAVDLRFPVLPPALAAGGGVPAGSVEAMERAAAAAAKLVADRYSLQSAAAMAAYLDNAFLLHGKTAFEMPASHAASSSASSAAATHRLFTPTPYYPAQHSALQSSVVKVNIFFSLSTL